MNFKKEDLIIIDPAILMGRGVQVKDSKTIPDVKGMIYKNMSWEGYMGVFKSSDPYSDLDYYLGDGYGETPENNMIAKFCSYSGLIGIFSLDDLLKVPELEGLLGEEIQDYVILKSFSGSIEVFNSENLEYVYLEGSKDMFIYPTHD